MPCGVSGCGRLALVGNVRDGDLLLGSRQSSSLLILQATESSTHSMHMAAYGACGPLHTTATANPISNTLPGQALEAAQE